MLSAMKIKILYEAKLYITSKNMYALYKDSIDDIIRRDNYNKEEGMIEFNEFKDYIESTSFDEVISNFDVFELKIMAIYNSSLLLSMHEMFY